MVTKVEINCKCFNQPQLYLYILTTKHITTHLILDPLIFWLIQSFHMASYSEVKDYHIKSEKHFVVGEGFDYLELWKNTPYKVKRSLMDSW